jgi:hypothetical protein
MLAPVLVLLAVAGGTIPACEDDSVFRSGDPPPSIGPDSDAGDGAAAGTGGAPADTDGGID